MRVWRLEALTDEDVASDRPACARGRGARAGRHFGPKGGVAMADEPFDHLVEVVRRRRAAGAQRPRGRGRARRGRGRPRRRRPRLPHPRPRRGRRAAAGPRLRPRRRRPLRHGVGVHQEPPRQRPGRGAVLARVDGRRRRGPAVHRPAADHLGLGGRRATPTRGRSRWPSRRPQALDHVGLPEAQYALAQATTYIATAPKSNRVGDRVLGGGVGRRRARLAARARTTSRPPATGG